MGYRGFIRAINSSIKAQERQQIRVQKALAKQEKELSRLSELERDALEVQQYENRIECLLSVHKDSCTEYDWHKLEKTLPPPQPKLREKPELDDTQEMHWNEQHYKTLMENYKPNIFAKLFGLDKRKLKKWNSLLENGKLDDQKITLEMRERAKGRLEFELKKWQEECDKLQKRYEEEYVEYTGIVNLAKSINQGNLESYAHVIQDADPFEEISEFGSEVVFTICSATRAKITILTHDDAVIPRQSKTLLKSGKLSVKDMPVGKFNEIYQDYVCSVSIRVARDLFALLPLDEIIVTAKENCLNSSTGRMEVVPLLSVLFVKDTIKRLDLETIDPSDSMKNFKSNMSFKKSQGMSATQELDF